MTIHEQQNSTTAGWRFPSQFFWHKSFGNLAHRKRSVPRCVPLVLGLLAGIALWLDAAHVFAQASTDAAKVVGHQKCAECHKSEVAAWLQSPHGSKSYQMLSDPKADDFAKAMGITGSLDASVCADCHATKTTAVVLKGVSCERCHGGAGPVDTGWFAVHGDYGNADKDRLKETPDHYQTRIAACGELGMNRSADMYAIAKNCLSCHTVPNEKLVNAGHPTSSRFELVEWSQGSVRHNFQMDQQVNAESPTLWLDAKWNGPGRTVESRKQLMYVIGLLVDLEVSLRSRAMATGRSDFASDVNRRITGVRRDLAKIDHIAEVKQALDATASLDRATLRDFGPNDEELYGSAADEVATAAKSLAANHPDGNDLGDVEAPDKANGDPYVP